MATDLEGRVSYVNDAVCRFFGRRPEQIVGRSVFQFGEDSMRGATQQEIIDTTLAEGQWQGTVVNVAADGRECILASRTRLILDADGRPIGMVGASTDVTEQRRTEQERVELQERLMQSQKMEALGRLASGVAHDFNNLLTGINGYVEMILAEAQPSEPVRADLEEIRQAGERAAALTTQLLAFSRKQVVTPTVIRPNEVLGRLQNMLYRIIGEDVVLEFKLSEDLGHIKVDPTQLDQIMVNLAANARDAMPEGGRLTATTRNITLCNESMIVDGEPVMVSGDYVSLEVADTGCGMDEETKRHVYEPFYSTKGGTNGTGLGLATVYGIVRQNHGFITCETTPGRGSTFRIYFPQIADEAKTPLERTSTESPHGDETILLVEDEDMVRHLARRTLERYGYQVVVAADGEKACCQSQEFDGEIHLLVSDIIMPGMNGHELLETLRKTRAGLKALLISGYSVDIIRHQSLLEEGHHFLPKPFRPFELARTVRQILDGGGGA
ncbi:MAG: response regulator [Candidatus Lernaella stagnicola]|nr:response regulator [Candidatus Lernaella stagnicola]